MADCPHYALESLASMDARDRQGGLLSPGEAMLRLQRLFVENGISPVEVTLRIEPHQVVIIEAATGIDREHIHLSLISQPASVTGNRVAGYDNLAMFTVLEDSFELAPPELHIFQCLDKSAQELVQDLNAAKAGKLFSAGSRKLSDARKPTRSSVTDTIKDFEEQAQRLASATISYRPGPNPGPMFRKALSRDEPELFHSDVTLRDIEMLNHCFDDIEKFVGRLQQAAEAFNELTRRRRDRHGGEGLGDGMLGMRSRPPPAADFIDIFQKFKLSFILLAKLKGQIRNPNAPELIHYLFSPLQLVVESSVDPVSNTPALASKVVTPLLSAEGLLLLSNCMSSLESDLLSSLGQAWNVPRDSWSGPLTPYAPHFFDGWSPPPFWLDDVVGQAGAPVTHRHSSSEDYTRQTNSNYPPVSQERYSQPIIKPVTRAASAASYQPTGNSYGSDLNRAPVSGPISANQPAIVPVSHPASRTPSMVKTSAGYAVANHKSGDDTQTQFLWQLRSRNAEIYQVRNDRLANNDKELTVKKGELLEILDSTRQWWKANNCFGHSGFVPITVLQKFSSAENSVPIVNNDNHADVVKPIRSYGSQSSLPPFAEEPVAAEVQDDSWVDEFRNAASRPRTAVDDLNDEFRQRMDFNTDHVPLRRAARSTPVVVYIVQDSNPEEILEWLVFKGFSHRAQTGLSGYTGRQLFALTRTACENLCGSEEGSRLYSQMLVQKNRSGFKTAKSSELEAILRLRKRKSDLDLPS